MDILPYGRYLIEQDDVEAVMVGLVADLIAFNRQLLERILTRLRRIELAADSGAERREDPSP